MSVEADPCPFCGVEQHGALVCACLAPPSTTTAEWLMYLEERAARHRAATQRLESRVGDVADDTLLRAGRDALAAVFEETFGTFEDHGVYNVVDEVASELYRRGWEISQRAGTHAGPHPFVLVRDDDPTGVSGTGVVAEGVEFTCPDTGDDDVQGVVALRWLSEWPTSVVFHDRGIDSVNAVHGHGGKTRVVWK